MIEVHHLNNSRSQRVLWLLEELGLDYDIVSYQRNAVTNLAPPELKDIHPLGKSPVIRDEARVMAESGAIIEYIVDTYGGGQLKPAPATEAAYDYLYWMHFAEGSAMLMMLLKLFMGKLGEAAAPMAPYVDGSIAAQMAYVDDHLGKSGYFAGSAFSAADVQMCFPLEAAAARGALDEGHGNIADFLSRMQARAAYTRAIERGGPYALMR